MYRGSSSDPEKIFKQGFDEHYSSARLEDYLKPRNSGIGVSTSRSFSVAEEYTYVSSRQGKRRFVYTIIYLGEGGLDIIETAKARALNLKNFKKPELGRALKKDEINIAGNIPSEYIYCATEFLPDGQERIFYNPKFNSQFSAEQPKFINKERSFIWTERITAILVSLWSHLKSLVWLWVNRHTLNHYGREYRSVEINHTPQMKEAETLFANIKKNKSSHQFFHSLSLKSKHNAISLTPDKCLVRTCAPL